MARTLILFPDAHGIARGKIANESLHPELEIGCASGVFSKDIFGIPQLFETLATPYGAADIKIRPEDGAALTFEPAPNFIFGVSSIAIGTVTDPRGQPHPFDFRRMLRDRIRQDPILDRYRFGAELEFHLQPLEGQLALQADGQAYAFSGAANLQACLEAMMDALDRVGIPWINFAQENHFNQYEFSLQYSAPLEQADRIFLARFLLRSVAALFSLRCTFTAVVSQDASPSNLHLHISESDSKPLEELCSGVASALAGPFLALCPTRNARLVKGIESFSSKKINIGEGDRFKALRVLKTKTGDRVELRTPTSDTNPYLTILMLLGALSHGADPAKTKEILASEADIEWNFEKSIDTFYVDPIVREVLSRETIELFTSLKRLEGKKSEELNFSDEVNMLMAVI